MIIAVILLSIICVGYLVLMIVVVRTSKRLRARGYVARESPTLRWVASLISRDRH